jgi:hypothetical protein
LLQRDNAFLKSLVTKRNESDSVEERSQLDEAIKVIGSKITASQNKIKRSDIDVGAELFSEITDEVNKLPFDVSQIAVIQSEFQADSSLAASITNGNSELVLTVDSDLAALVGVRCLGIKRFKFIDRNKTRSVHDIELFSADKETILEVVQHLNIPINDIVDAKFPLFEGIKNIRVRSLISIGVGCDVMINGVPGITPKVVAELLADMKREGMNEEMYYDYIMERFIASYQKKNKKILLTVTSVSVLNTNKC